MGCKCVSTPYSSFCFVHPNLHMKGAFRELFSKYCRQEINKGHCESDGCEFCSVNSAYDEIFNRFSDDEEDDTDE